MKSRIVQVVLAGTAMIGVAGCGSPEEGLARQTEQYQVIDEGAVTGVTSTIHAPGDMAPVPPPTPDVTGTNLDTTTAFTILDPRISTAPPSPLDTQTLPPAVSASPADSSAPVTRQPVPSTPVRRAPEREEPSRPAQEPRATPEPRPAPTATPVRPEPLPTPSATLPPQPDPEPEQEPETEPEDPEPTPPPATDTSAEPDV